MRLFLFGAAVFLSSTAAAQSRWTVSAGPDWTGSGQARFWGMRLRAEYDLTKPNSVFGLRLEGSGRWSPTQGFVMEGGMFDAYGVEQNVDLMVGLNASLAPLPRARVSPYLTMGLFARQRWTTGSQYVTGPTSSAQMFRSDSRGDLVSAMGLGLRLRLGSRAYQLELRAIQPNLGVTFGTRLPF